MGGGFYDRYDTIRYGVVLKIDFLFIFLVCCVVCGFVIWVLVIAKRKVVEN